MSHERKLWKSQIIAERVIALAAMIALEAGRLESEAFAVCAEEAGRLATRLLDLVERARFDDLPMSDFEKAAASELRRFELLAVNVTLEALRAEGGKGVAICSEGIRTAAHEFSSLLGLDGGERLGLSEFSEAERGSGQRGFFLAFEICGLRLVEGLSFVREVMSFDPDADPQPQAHYGTTTGMSRGYNLRGRLLPLIDLRQKLGLPDSTAEEGRRLVIVNCDWSGSPGREYAVIIDRIMPEGIFRSGIGRTAPLADSRFSPEFFRECWNAVDGSQFLFADWPRLGDEPRS